MNGLRFLLLFIVCLAQVAQAQVSILGVSPGQSKTETEERLGQPFFVMSGYHSYGEPGGRQVSVSYTESGRVDVVLGNLLEVGGVELQLDEENLWPALEQALGVPDGHRNTGFATYQRRYQRWNLTVSKTESGFSFALGPDRFIVPFKPIDQEL